MDFEAVFLDRDGTLNEEVSGWLTQPDELVLTPGAAAAVARLNAAGLPVIVVTNQSGLARGHFTAEDLALIHERLVDLLAEEGAWLDALLVCPHGPDDGCDCRKPLPGLLLWAAREFGLDPARCVVVGDAPRDLAAGRAAGCEALVLVRTGKGSQTESELAGTPEAPTVVLDHLAAAADWILH